MDGGAFIALRKVGGGTGLGRDQQGSIWEALRPSSFLVDPKWPWGDLSFRPGKLCRLAVQTQTSPVFSRELSFHICKVSLGTMAAPQPSAQNWEARLEGGDRTAEGRGHLTELFLHPVQGWVGTGPRAPHGGDTAPLRAPCTLASPVFRAPAGNPGRRNPPDCQVQVRRDRKPGHMGAKLLFQSLSHSWEAWSATQ